MTDDCGVEMVGCTALGDGENTSSMICFGMLYLDIAILRGEPSTNLDGSPVQLGSDGNISDISIMSLAIGRIEKRYHDLLELFQKEGLQLQLSLSQHVGGKQGSPGEFALRAILYGVDSHILPLMDVLTAQDLYLQLPIQPFWNVTYYNPQSLFNEPGLRTTDDIFHPLSSCLEVTTSVFESKNVLDDFDTGAALDETECTEHIITPLKSHQKQALSFMLARERGWRLEATAEDIWSVAKTSGNQINGFVNNVDGSIHDRPPPPCHGGIIADTMGYGKTLAMIALIAFGLSETANTARNYVTTPKTTLIVVPASLMTNWDNELTKHTKSNAIRWFLDNGPKRMRRKADVDSIDVLLVSYETLARDWTTCKSTSLLFQTRWHRVILDEAHNIKNPKTVTTRAAYEIKARNRWAVTATPITNRLLDLFPLLKFIGAYPYNHKENFLGDISDLVRQDQGQEQLAVERMRRLLSAMMLRRSKELPLPTKTEQIVSLRLGDHETELYNEAKDRALATIDDAFSLSASSNVFRNILQKIDVLRQICTFGGSNKPLSATPTPRSPFRGNDWDRYAAAKAFSQMLDLGLHAVCSECRAPLLASADQSVDQAVVYLSECLLAWCKSCYEEDFTKQSSRSSRACACDVPCVVAPAAVSESSATVSPEATEELIDHNGTPSKIRALVEDVCKQTPRTKSVVFSFWKATLDIARSSLSRAGIQCLQVDGTVKPKERNRILETFSSPNDYQVLLLSLSCGAVGLTLTAASRAYLMEPQWNPAIEDQAFGRVHRITQMQKTTMIRYVIEDTIEQYVRKVQDGKKDLITAFLSPRGNTREVSLQRLRDLRNYL